MSNLIKTSLLVLLSIILIVVANMVKPTVFDDSTFTGQGEKFYPDFTDPLKVAKLEKQQA